MVNARLEVRANRLFRLRRPADGSAVVDFGPADLVGIRHPRAAHAL